MPRSSCAHTDIRKFDGIRCCLACGEAVFEATTAESLAPAVSTIFQVPYQYTKVNYELGQEVRLVVLLPGDSNDPIRCEIIHVNLEDEPEYDAVSYTWATEGGDDRLTGQIHCVHGAYIPITTNCDAALRQLRHRGLRRRVWIDVLCIDQTNVDERNHQVSLMDKIYSRARCVRMCLQDPSISDSSVCYGRLFHCLQAAEHSYLKEVGPWVNQTLVHLFSLRYFRRVWVIQEVALARAAYLLVDNHELLLTSTVMERLSIHGIRNHHRLPGVLRWIPGHRIEADLFTCLQVGIDCEATDARDRVFAMLSLMEPHIRSLIPVDYSLEPEAVYSSAIIAIMATEQNLDILSYASIVHGLVDEDWPRDPSMGMQQFKQYLVEKFVTSPGRSKLKMFEGERVGPWRSTIHVNIVAPASYHEHQAKQQNISCIIQRPQPPSRGLLPLFCVRAHYIDSVDNTHLFPEAINAMGLAQNIFGDPYLIQLERYSWCHSCFKRSQPEPLSYLDLCLPYGHNLAAFAESSKPDTNLHDLYAFLEALFMKGSSKKMFLSKYSVGCADSGFQHGDAIFAIDGARAPFILRKTETQRYRIIGECYLWAALELDYWNPGTKKGRWDANDQGPRPTQTQMIEIY